MKTTTNPEGDHRPHRTLSNQELSYAIEAIANQPITIQQIELYNEIAFRWKEIHGFPRSLYWDSENRMSASSGVTVIESKVESLGNGYSRLGSEREIPNKFRTRVDPIGLSHFMGETKEKCQDCGKAASHIVTKPGATGGITKWHLCDEHAPYQFPSLFKYGSETVKSEDEKMGIGVPIVGWPAGLLCPSCGSSTVEPWGKLWICRGTLTEWSERNPNTPGVGALSFSPQEWRRQCGTVFAIDQPKAA